MSSSDRPSLDSLKRASLPPSAPSPFATLDRDLASSVVVFLVAVPLCLGIAIASGAPPLAGLVTGVVGGVVVALLSGSHTAVSGPAAGLVVIVAAAITDLGYEGMLLATCVAGVLQILAGLMRAGVFAYYFPSAVIKGMLAAIGLILVFKQIPHALGFDGDFEGDEAFLQPDGRNTLTEIAYALTHAHLGACLLAAGCLTLLVTLERTKVLARVRWLPAPLLVVVLGVAANAAFGLLDPSLAVGGALLVQLPTGGFSELLAEVRMPAWERIGDAAIWRAGVTIAAVASLETLLSVEAMDKLDPQKRSTPTNRELVAQGIGNCVVGAIGGLPMTAVVVRGSANVQAGAKTRMSAFFHGVMLLAAVVLLPSVMNLVPLSVLAAVLLHVGYKLASVALFRRMAKQKVDQWLPFGVTVVATVFTDLLIGVGIGMVVGLLFILKKNLDTAYYLHHLEAHEDEAHRLHVRLELGENVSFLNKASVSKVLHELPHQAVVEIDGTSSTYIDADVVEIIHEFVETANLRSIDVSLRGVPRAKNVVSVH